jgi:uncharacterized protein YceH (UPF0502 family)
MTFLQPFILWALPLVALPVLIHLLSAHRHSVRHARLRHFLLLAFRVLVIAALIFGLARPLVGGWLGWAMRGAPDTIIILLDRSASMEQQDARTHTAKRVRALQRLADAAKDYAGTSRFVLFENVARTPQEISSPALLPELSSTGPTDSAADVPALLNAALDYFSANQCGRTEIWLATDLQADNWQARDPRWQALQSRIAALPQDVRVRLLALPDIAPDNISISIAELRRQRAGERSELWLTLDLARAGSDRVSFPLFIGVEGARTPLNVAMDGQHVRLQHRIDLDARASGGWGVVELPPDANERDNRYYFAFGEDVHLSAVVVAEDNAAGRVLQLAAAPAPKLLNQSSKLVSPSELAPLKWNETALVVWAGAAPSAEAAQNLRAFIEGGGAAIFFPRSSGNFADVTWGEQETATGTDKSFRVTRWRNTDGPLAQTQDGVELPVSELRIARRRSITGEANVLAAFEDGKPFLVRKQVGAGAVYFCATLPHAEWSNLAEGAVLVPMLQRLLAAGGQRLSRSANLFVGDKALRIGGDARTRLDRESEQAGDAAPDAQAGIYQIGNRIVAVNRPPAEDATETVDETTVRASFGPVPLTMFEQPSANAGKLQSELWRGFLVAMIVFMLGEAWLALPGRTRADTTAPRVAAKIDVREPVEAEVR